MILIRRTWPSSARLRSVLCERPVRASRRWQRLFVCRARPWIAMRRMSHSHGYWLSVCAEKLGARGDDAVLQCRYGNKGCGRGRGDWLKDAFLIHLDAVCAFPAGRVLITTAPYLSRKCVSESSMARLAQHEAPQPSLPCGVYSICRR